MAVTPTRGEAGWAKIGAVDLYAISATPRDDPALYAPMLAGHYFPLNYASGISVPAADVVTNVYTDFWSAAQFGNWFGVSNAVRAGDVAPTGTPALYYNDGSTSGGFSGLVGNTFSLELVQGAPTMLTMGFVGLATATTTGTRTGTSSPIMSADGTFTGATGVHRYALNFSNNCRASGEIGGSTRPVAITSDAPTFTVTLLQKPGGTIPTTTLTTIIGGATIITKFRLTAGPNKVIAAGEVLEERVFTGMHVASGDVPFSIAWA